MIEQALPTCENCGRSDRYNIGVADVTRWKRDQILAAQRQRERELEAVVVIQRAYRYKEQKRVRYNECDIVADCAP